MPLTGLQKICKLYGRMKVGGRIVVWDYVNDVAVREKDMPRGSARWKASEAAHLNEIRLAMLELKSKQPQQK